MDKQYELNKACETAFTNEPWLKVNYATGCYQQRLSHSIDNYRNLDLEKNRALQVRRKSLYNLEKLLIDFEKSYTTNGGTVLWAKDSADACHIITDILNKNQVTEVMRCQSDELEEVNINKNLKNANIKVNATSVEGFILKSGGEKNFHPTMPTMNLSNEEINDILTKNYRLKANSTMKQMVNFIRFKVNESMGNSKVILTGADFIISEEGGLVLVCDEGNVQKALSAADIHIAVVGFDRIVPSMNDLNILLPLYSMYAFGQGIAINNTVLFGNGNNGSNPKKSYVIILDNGRSEVLKHEKQRNILSCIHCGACVNVCPIFKNIGGPAYNTAYVGPLGTVLSPLMKGMKNYAHLTSLCSMCGQCSKACPVQIPLDSIMMLNRHEMIEKKYDDPKLDIFFKMLIKTYKSRKLMNMPAKIKNFTFKKMLDKNYGNRKNLPKFAPKTFSKMWQEMNHDNE